MKGDFHAGICGRPGAAMPPATRPPTVAAIMRSRRSRSSVHIPSPAGQEQVGEAFWDLLPAVSKDAVKAMGRDIRSWHIASAATSPSPTWHACSTASCKAGSTTTAASTSRCCIPLLRRINDHLVRWACRKTQTAAPTRKTSKRTPGPRRPTLPGLVRPLALRPQTRRLDDGSRVSREASARFCERRGVRFPPPTHLGDQGELCQGSR